MYFKGPLWKIQKALVAEMEYSAQKYVFISLQSPVTTNHYVFVSLEFQREFSDGKLSWGRKRKRDQTHEGKLDILRPTPDSGALILRPEYDMIRSWRL